MTMGIDKTGTEDSVIKLSILTLFFQGTYFLNNAVVI